MPVHFLFPSNPLRARRVETTFADQFAALATAGYSVSLCPESVIRNDTPLQNILAGSTVVYRGWMLNAEEYVRLDRAVVEASAHLMTSPESYLATHYLPNWYSLIEEFTPETRVFSTDAHFEAELCSLGWPAFFIKDYVKSLKNSVGSIIYDPVLIRTVISEMLAFRGTIEGGICVRRVEPFVAASERRYFVLNGCTFAPDGEEVPTVVREVAERVSSKFYSVDVIRRNDDVLRVVEIGDGQVSDLVGWSVDAFVAMWQKFDCPVP